MMAAIAAVPAAAAATSAAADADDVSFYQRRPGLMTDIGDLRLHIDCRGEGDVTVLFEAGLGGNALEWEAVRRQLGAGVRHCSYDRAGYGWSDPAGVPRTAWQLAREARLLMHHAGLHGRVVLVGHSFGGFVVRLLARLIPDQIVGLVLVDTSHERQLERLEANGRKRVMPLGGHFVMSGIRAPDNLPEDVQAAADGFARMRKTYATAHGEMRDFRRSAQQVAAARETVDYPVTVIHRGRRVFAERGEDGARDDIWIALQEDLAAISRRGRVVQADGSGHHVHLDEPMLVTDAIEELLDAR